MRFIISLLVAAFFLCGCSLVSGPKREMSPLQIQVLEFLDAGRPKAALVAADQLVAESPEDYQGYLTRNTVYLVLREYAQAQADNDKALEVFQANLSRYPEKERNYRLAKIHESFALTSLIASRRAQDPQERKRLEGLFNQHAEQVKALDEETWKNMRGLAGEQVGE